MMQISLRTSAMKTVVSTYTSLAVPRVGEHIQVAEGGLFRVVGICYQAQAPDQHSSNVDVEVMPVDDAARHCAAIQYAGTEQSCR